MLRSQIFRAAAVFLVLALLVSLVAHLLRHPQTEFGLPTKAPGLVLNLPDRIQAGVPFAGTAKVTGSRLLRPTCSRPDIQFRSDGVIAWAQPLAGTYEITFTVTGSGGPMTANWQVTVFEPPPKKERPKVARIAALQRQPPPEPSPKPPPEAQTGPRLQSPPEPPPRREPPPPTEPAPRPPPVAVEPAPQPATTDDTARREAYARHQAALAAAKAARKEAAKTAEEVQARTLAKVEEARLRKTALEKAAQAEKNAMRRAQLTRQAELQAARETEQRRRLEVLQKARTRQVELELQRQAQRAKKARERKCREAEAWRQAEAEQAQRDAGDSAIREPLDFSSYDFILRRAAFSDFMDIAAHNGIRVFFLTITQSRLDGAREPYAVIGANGDVPVVEVSSHEAIKALFEGRYNRKYVRVVQISEDRDWSSINRRLRDDLGTSAEYSLIAFFPNSFIVALDHASRAHYRARRIDPALPFEKGAGVIVFTVHKPDRIEILKMDNVK